MHFIILSVHILDLPHYLLLRSWTVPPPTLLDFGKVPVHRKRETLRSSKPSLPY